VLQVRWSNKFIFRNIQPLLDDYIKIFKLIYYIYYYFIFMRKETIKIVAIGDGTVGKTCILVRYRDDSFPKNYIPTIVENYPKELKLPGIVV